MDTTVIIFLFRTLGNFLQFIEGWFFMKCIDCCLKRKHGILPFAAGLVGYTVVSSIVIFPRDLYNISFAFVLFLLLNFLLYKGNCSVKLAIAIILLPISSALNFLVFDITGKLYFIHYKAEDTLPNSICSNLSIILPAAFFAAFYHFFHKKLAKIQETFTDSAWGITSVICAASFTGIFSCLFLSPEHKTYYIWPCAFACIATNIGSLQLASSLADGILADLERKNLQLQKNYYEELEHSQNQIRRFRHDLNHHLAVVGQLLENGNTNEAKAYFAKISGSIQTASRRFCANSVVNAVLNAKYALAKEAGIDLFFHISIDGMMLLDDVSLCTIFANTLDNAIEACRKIEDPSKRSIELKCRYTENGYFSFSLVNTKNNEIKRRKDRYLTDKEDQKIHGIGISSVQGIVERYEGTLDITYDGQSFRVVILIG